MPSRRLRTTFIPVWRALRRNAAPNALLERTRNLAAMHSTFVMRGAPMTRPRFLPASVLLATCLPKARGGALPPGQLTKYSSLGNQDRSAPISVRMVRAELVDARQIHRRIAVRRAARGLFSPAPGDTLLGRFGVLGELPQPAFSTGLSRLFVRQIPLVALARGCRGR